MKKNALISVYDKSNIVILCEYFKKNNVNIISTGNTAKHINNLGYKCVLISNLTKFNEMLDGRVKTLHPFIHASLLYDRKKNSHIKEFNKIKFPNIDYVFVNLYPFDKINLSEKYSYNEILEMIDIGGPTLLRSAAKNYLNITAIHNPNDYKKFIIEMNKNDGNTSLLFRKKMAKKIFHLTSNYDKAIFNWFDKESYKVEENDKIKLRYGENPHQASYFIKTTRSKTLFDGFIHGKQLSYNNLKDSETAFECVNDFRKPTCVIIKHGSPCGVSTNKNINMAFINSKNTDQISSFGGIVAINRTLDESLAKLIYKDFYEIIIAPNFNKKSLELLKTKKNLILIQTKNIQKYSKNEVCSFSNGKLVQEKNNIIFDKKFMKNAGKYKGSKNNIRDLIFAFKVCKYVKSNAIVLANNETTIAIGGGQTSRIDSVKIAINKLKKNVSFVTASDAFFPFTDGLKLIIKNKCKALIQPDGSLNDGEIIKFANKKKLPLYFSKYRYFRH